VSQASRRNNVSFRYALLNDERLRDCFTPQALEDLLDPATYTGLAAEMVDLVAGKPLSNPSSNDLERAMSTQGNPSQSQRVMEDM
jgi:adenylosuccinate lyase